MADFPTALTGAVDNTTDVLAKHLNNLEEKVGIDNSADTDSLDYKVRAGIANLLKNGNFINNSTNGYGATPDDWTNSTGSSIQGGFPSMTKAELISLLGVADGDIEGLWLLNEASGDALDLSSNGYNLTETSGTIDSDTLGLMGAARDFEAGDTEYFTIADASCANLEIAGSQTWFGFYKPETIPAGATIMGKYTAGTFKILDVDSGKVRFILQGLTTTDTLTSDVILETGKWYFICGVYNESTINLYVNGVKKSATATGSATDTNGAFSIGALGAGATSYADGLIQCAGVLSVALTDAQVKRLWAATTYRGEKLRRTTTDALIYQDLEQDLVERLRSKTVTLRAKIYATSTDHRIYIYDGTDTTIVSPSGANAWEEISVTATIGAAATTVRVGLEADATDGNMWVKEVALYEGSVALPHTHSKEDWIRFPRLLRMDIPKFYALMHPYKYEENRWFNGATTITGFSANPTYHHRFMFSGKNCWLSHNATGLGTSNASTFTMTLPIYPGASSATGGQQSWLLKVFDAGTGTNGMGYINANALELFKTAGAGTFTSSGNKGAQFRIDYEID